MLYWSRLLSIDSPDVCEYKDLDHKDPSMEQICQYDYLGGSII